MISVDKAWSLIREKARPLPAETIPLQEAEGRILRQSLRADRDYPPFDRVAMDGYALSFAAWKEGRTHFKIQEMQTAGQAPKDLRLSEHCIEIMTGAKLPTGCDLVIRYEDTERIDDSMVIAPGLAFEPFTNVHRQGVDCKAGALFADDVMNGPVAALAASFGMARLSVARKARVAIIGTGDELVAIDAAPKDYQIRASNIHGLRLALESKGHDVVFCETLADQKDRIEARVRIALEAADIVLLSGGVSAGKTDFIPAVLKDCGVEEVFHKIAQRPGKPLWFGANQSGKIVFGLPGNPVSTLICFYRYVLPFIQLTLDARPGPQPIVHLVRKRMPASKLTFFLPVRISYGDDAVLRAEAPDHHGSGDFAALSGTHGFVEIPGELEPGYDPAREHFTFYSW